MSLTVFLDPKAPLKSNLYVDTHPKDARIRILNIGPKFYQGMALDAGRYHVEVSANGYEAQKLWITLGSGEDRFMDVRLKKRAVAPSFSYSSYSSAREIKRDGRFIAYDNGTVKDTKTGLMWAAKDNWKDINYEDAKQYCENYRGGGYADWRMPTLQELYGLYDETKSYKAKQRGYKVHLTKLIQLTTCCVWGFDLEDSKGNAAIFTGDWNFFGGMDLGLGIDGSLHRRALPVRDDN